MFDRYSFMAELRLGFGLPRKVTRRRADYFADREAYWLRQARAAAGFGSWRSYARCARRAMVAAFRAEWHRALRTTYETTEGGRRHMAVLTGLTA